jgi:hypothetical protein
LALLGTLHGMEEAARLVASVGAVVQRLRSDGPDDLPRHFLEPLAMYDRCRGLFNAVRLLTDNAMGREAVALTRPLFTESLMLLEWASADDTRRVELTVGYALASLADFEGIMLEGQSRGDDTSLELEAVARRREQILDYARRHDAGTRRWNVDEKTLADKHRDGDGYLDFRMSHHFVHGSAFAGEQRVTKRGDLVVVGDPQADQEWAEGAALSAAQSMLYAVRGICRIIGWDEPLAVDDLLARLDRHAQERQQAKASS